MGYSLGGASGDSSWLRHALANTRLRLGVKNLFNRVPPSDQVNGLTNVYYSEYGDVRLADYYISVKKSW